MGRWRYGRSHSYRHDALRPLVKAAFKQLRAGRGLITRMGFMCCMSCACAALDEMLEKRPKIRGAVYFHRQDDESFRDGYDLHLRYAPRGDDPDNDVWKALGYEVVEALREIGRAHV